MPPHNRRRRNAHAADPTRHMTPKEKEDFLRQQKFELPLAEIGLPVRIVNTLEENGMLKVQHLLNHTREHFMRIENFGDKTMSELSRCINGLGLEVPESWAKQ